MNILYSLIVFVVNYTHKIVQDIIFSAKFQMIELIMFAMTTVSLKILLMQLNKVIYNKPAFLAFLINAFRLIFSTTAAICLLFQKPVASFVIFISGCGTYLVNIPLTTLRIRKSKYQKISLYLISDSFFTFPILCAFLILSTKEYQDFCSKFQLSLQYAEQFLDYPVSLILIYLVLEFWLAAYPQVRFNVKTNVSTYTKCFLSILSIIYQYLLSIGVKITPSFLFYAPIKRNKNTDLWPSQLLTAAEIVNIIQFVFHSIPQYWYANLLSLINMFMGFLAIIYIKLHYYEKATFNRVLEYIVAGQFADLFDGRAAKKFGGTKHGELFDDAADFTSFGLASGFLVFKLLRVDGNFNILVSALVSLFYVGCVSYRLIRFVVEKRKAGVQGGVFFFSGMPSPCGSMVVLLCGLIGQSQKLFGNQIFRYGYAAVVVVISWLMVSRVKYPHAGRVFATKKFFTGKVRSLFITFMVTSFVKATTDKDLFYVYIFMSSCVGFYVFCPIFAAKLNLYKTVTEKEDSKEDSEVVVADFVKKEKSHKQGQENQETTASEE